MFEKQPYDSPPMYTPPSNGFGPPGSFQDPRSEFDPYPAPPGSYYVGEEVPQHFYKWLSPPGIVKIMIGIVIILCLGIFACVASTLVWDMQYGYGYGSGFSGYPGYGSGYGYGNSYGYGSGYGGGYGYGGYYNSYPTPYSAKTTMIAVAAINFIVALGFFAASFSKTNTFRSRKFYLAVLVVCSIMAVIQGIINIVYIVGVNPMAQSSTSSYYNPMLLMCQNLYGSSVTGMGAGFPLYNQYLYHYCYVDPQEAVAMVCGFLVVAALAVAAFFSYKTRSRIWQYGKPNIYWDRPLMAGPEGRDVEEWVNHVQDGQSVQEASMVFSEKMAPVLASAPSVGSIPLKTGSVLSSETHNVIGYPERSFSRPSHSTLLSGEVSSSPSDQTDTIRKPSASRSKRRRRNPELDESQYETEYTTGGETANDFDEDFWTRLYPEITSDTQRHEYKKEFDSDLRTYKELCAEMDDINDQINKLSRELDTLEEGTSKYEAVAEEYNRLKDVKRMPDYQNKKHQCRKLRHKLFHIKRMVKVYDRRQ
ncbi:occludin-like protein [Labeo rohita]|uniref:Occludin n=1 Tax=Labeo rohita TaxID=84645 RepID=A0A498LV97_LABRO|nr:LOW QUALITY PROTEIN: occludin [Labeo rohita]RXN12379.1 occludin-like protein [Labeo rohita]RXN24014.1 occludin-like protein [Labeo rohita]